MILRRSLILAIVGSLPLGSLPLLQVAAWAGPPTDQLRPAFDEVIQILDDPSLKPGSKAAARQARVRAVVVDLFDFPEMASRSLGRHWRALSEWEREEFVRLFRALLEHTYLPKIALYQSERVRFTGEAVDGDLATVQSLVITRDGKEVPVSYRLRLRDGRWLVYDISGEGISLIGNYRSQFNEIIQRRSYQELVRRIREKLTSPASPEALEPASPASRK